MTSTTDLTSNVVPDLCRNNCGFFASSSFDGYCSQCYNQQRKNVNEIDDRVQQQDRVSVEMKGEHVVIEPTMPVENLSLPASSKVTIENNIGKKSRCPNCKKTMGILQYPCACGGHFCSKCRYSNEHHCPIDYKAMGRKILAKANPQIVADRVHNRQ
jgi:hypothetical protein